MHHAGVIYDLVSQRSQSRLQGRTKMDSEGFQENGCLMEVNRYRGAGPELVG